MGGRAKPAARRGCPRPPPPQAPATKPPRRTKKRRPRRSAATTTAMRADKHHRKTRKQQARSAPLLAIPSAGRNPGSAKNAAEEKQKDAETNQVVISTSPGLESCQADQGLSAQLNESLRWDRILDDPVAEEERLRIYKMNRRKRYELYIQQYLPDSRAFPATASQGVTHKRQSHRT